MSSRPVVVNLLVSRSLCVAALLLLSTSASAANDPPWLTGQSRGEDLVIKLVTFSPGAPSFSYVVKRRLHAVHTRRRRNPSAVTRVSVTLESPPQYGHCTR